MTSSVIPARLEFQCGHAALVSLPRIKGESSAQRNERVTREKSAAQMRACDFCGPDVAIMVQAAAPDVALVAEPREVVQTLAVLETFDPEPLAPAVEAVVEALEAQVEALEEAEAELEALADVEAIAELEALT